MSSIVYNSFLFDTLSGNIDLGVDTFKLMLVTSGYVPDKDAHTKRSNITSEVVGTGYVSGGEVCALTRLDSLPLDRSQFTLAVTQWNPSTITARGAVLYKSRGGAASLDELVAYLDFGSDIISINGPFTVTPTNPLIFQN